MEKGRNIKVLSLAALIVAVLGLTVAFAALSQQLTINGSAKVDAATWDIHFANLQNTVGAEYVTQAPAIGNPTEGTANTVIGDYQVTFTKPGQAVEFTFDVVNTGSIDAILSDITPETLQPTCTGTGTNAAADAALVCSGLTYTLTYADGTPLTKNNETTGVLTKNGGTKSMKLRLAYNIDVNTSLTINDVTIRDLGISLTYVQK